MHPVQVDVVRLQPAQRLLARAENALAIRPAPVGVAAEHVPHELGRKHEPIALGGVLADVVADDLFGVALGVDVGSIEEVPAALDVGVHDFLRVRDVGPPTPVEAEGHGAEAERTDAQAAAAEGGVVGEGHTKL